MDIPPADHIAKAAILLRNNGLADVVKFLMATEARERRAERPCRERGIQVRVGPHGSRAVLSEKRIKELLEASDGPAEIH